MSSEKTEKPTAKKKRESREEGQVAKTPAIGKALALAAVFEMIVGTRDSWRGTLEQWVVHAIRVAGEVDGNRSYYLHALTTMPIFDSFMAMSMVALMTATIIELVAGFAQVGIQPAPAGMIHAEAMNPVSNVMNMFSAQQYITLLVNILKVIIIGVCALVALYRNFDGLVQVAAGTPDQVFNAAVAVIVSTERTAILALLIFAAIDWVVAFKAHMKQMMMAKEEVDRERKEQFGSKEVRQYRRRLSRELTSDQPAADKAKKANAVVTNPTHFAIALRYQPEECPLPVVLARCEGEEALTVIAAAAAEGIPIIRSVWLARTLFSVGREGQVIPRVALQATAAVYKAIAEVLDQGGDFKGVIQIEDGPPQ